MFLGMNTGMFPRGSNTMKSIAAAEKTDICVSILTDLFILDQRDCLNRNTQFRELRPVYNNTDHF